MAKPTTTWPRHRRTFLIQPLLLVAILTVAVRPASSQLFTPPPGYTFTRAFSPPSPPSAAAEPGSGGSGAFNLTTSLLFVALIIALFLLGFFSAYLRRCADAATSGGGTHRNGASTASLRANAAVAAAAAAAFASAAGGGGRRRPTGLDPAAMEALPVLTYATAKAVKAGRGALECAVCLAEFGGDGEKLRLLPGCCHVFHAACIDVWLAAHVTCPVCRADLSDPAVADAGHVLAADLAAQAETPIISHHAVVVNVDTSESTPQEHSTTSPDSYQQMAETAEERVDRYTLRLPDRLKREIEAARRHRRALSAVPAASSGRWTSEALRTMSTARLSRRWSGLFRVLSASRRSEADSSHHRRVAVAPLRTGTATGGDGGEVEVVVVQGDEGAHMDKHYAHSLTFAGFVIDGDVAAGDWNPEVFQVSTAVPPATTARSSQR
ncbi:hypothetical protein PR202_gn00356 [Eleusine coracana subsp. coracana]|uniref:RING-type E3 ubiquitin transferase n=1 Tax=Eleusine coracana subsp. coracana TaxID=191504 RepID=A0AAV5FZH4_ELECO|nr:hypothetical protein QOZ80_3AG0250950 [Eleusine coracana subsp. coracana]GJN41034.1 hypothetical protein PR202_gn00356 [Eleusine coracana subsp. coracana]